MSTINQQSIDLKTQHNIDNRDIKAVSLIAESKFPVYLVKSAKYNRKLAMKVFAPSKITEKCFKTESRIKNLNHENIINIVESSNSCTKTETNYILMEYAKNGDLGCLLTEKKLPKNEKLARTLFKQILSGIEYLHTQGVAHLDIKPDNILLTEDGTAKVADFDCCFIKGDEKVTTGGTQNYRAPEVCSFQCQNPKAADVYSLGILLFALRTGMVPYTENMTSNSMKKLLKLAVDRNEDFWAEHNNISGQNNSFTKEFKELFWMLTEVFPKDRIVLEKISEHSWMKGPVYTPEEMARLFH